MLIKKIVIAAVTMLLAASLSTCGKTSEITECRFVPADSWTEYMMMPGKKTDINIRPVKHSVPDHYELTYSNGRTEKITVEEYELRSDYINMQLGVKDA